MPEMPEVLSITDELTLITNGGLIIEVKGVQTVLTWSQARIFATVIKAISNKR